MKELEKLRNCFYSKIMYIFFLLSLPACNLAAWKDCKGGIAFVGSSVQPGTPASYCKDAKHLAKASEVKTSWGFGQQAAFPGRALYSRQKAPGFCCHLSTGQVPGWRQAPKEGLVAQGHPRSP